MKNNNSKLKILNFTLLFFVFSFAFYPFRSLAASPQVTLTTDQSEVSISQLFSVKVSLLPGGESINAIAGEITLPEFLDLKQIEDGGSIISFWIERPAVRDGKVTFSGIVPGGFTGDKGSVFSLDLTVKTSGKVVLSVQKLKVLRNDGQGSELAVKTPMVSIMINKTKVETGLLSVDNIKPEPFQPLLSRDPSLFNGDWFLAFMAQDKQSGIDHYEVRERENNQSWIITESPYPLRDQSLRGTIDVRAVDRAGNIQSATVILRPWYGVWIYGGILILISIFILWFVGFIIRKLFGRPRRLAS